MLHQRFLFFSLLVANTLFLQVNSEGCLLDVHPAEECPETEYEAYITCLQQRRVKRSICNEEPCNECNCSYCETNSCSEMCNNCCEISFSTCDTAYCCYKRCHSQCHSGECRRNCRKSCNDNIVEKKTQIDGERVQLPNITTVINLHNQINNTNILDIPISINTTNINNITLESSDLNSLNVQSDQPTIVDSPPEEVVEVQQNCCHIVSPRQCVPQNEFPFLKCFHYRQKVCGDMCQAPIMHTQSHQICDENPSGPPECHNQIIYIPQPQPKCTYLDTWPYVNCNVQTMENSYNVGPYNQFQYGQNQYPYPYQPYFGPNNMQGYPFAEMENFYTITKNVGENQMLNEEENYISETIPIEINQKENEVDPTLVKIQVQNKPMLTIKEAEEDPQEEE